MAQRVRDILSEEIMKKYIFLLLICSFFVWYSHTNSLLPDAEATPGLSYMAYGGSDINYPNEQREYRFPNISPGELFSDFLDLISSAYMARTAIIVIFVLGFIGLRNHRIFLHRRKILLLTIVALAIIVFSIILITDHIKANDAESIRSNLFIRTQHFELSDSDLCAIVKLTQPYLEERDMSIVGIADTEEYVAVLGTEDKPDAGLFLSTVQRNGSWVRHGVGIWLKTEDEFTMLIIAER